MLCGLSFTRCKEDSMDKVELKVTMEPERLDALRYFLSAKEKSTPEKKTETDAGRTL